MKKTISEDCTKGSDSVRPRKYHCLLKDVERREKPRLDVLRPFSVPVARSAVASDMPKPKKEADLPREDRQAAKEVKGLSQATPIMRNVTPVQRMSHASPPRSSMAPTPVMNQAAMVTPQMGNQMPFNPQQQQFLMQRQQLLAQQGQHLNHSQLTPPQFAQLQGNMLAQNNIQNQQQQQPQPQSQQQPQHKQGQMLQNSPQFNAQQQQMLMAAAQANGGQLPQNMLGMGMQPRINTPARYNQLYQQRLLRLRQDMATRLMPQYGPPTQYPPHVAQEYSVGLENAAKAFVQDLIRRERVEFPAAQQRQALAAAHAQAVQQQAYNMMRNGMGK
jgi:transcription factor SPT20